MPLTHQMHDIEDSHRVRKNEEDNQNLGTVLVKTHGEHNNSLHVQENDLSDISVTLHHTASRIRQNFYEHFG